MSQENKKTLIIPFPTPIIDRNTNALLTEEEVAADLNKSNPKGILSSELLNKMFRFVIRELKTKQPALHNCAFFISSITGEGESITLDIWKDLLQQSFHILKGNFESIGISKLFVGVLFEKDKNPDTDKISDALDYIENNFKHKGEINLVFQYELADWLLTQIENIKKRFTISFILGDKEKYLSDKEIANRVKNFIDNGYTIKSFKDARRNPLTADSNIGNLKSLLPDILILEGWEDRYLDTYTKCDGGNFPLALIEPKYIYDFTLTDDRKEKVNKEIVIANLLAKYASVNSKKWRFRLKDYFNKRPDKIKLIYDRNDYHRAWDLFFEDYSSEKSDNIHVQNFDLENPKFSILKSLLSDLLSFQAKYFKFNYAQEKNSQFLFLPIYFELKETSKPNVKPEVIKLFEKRSVPEFLNKFASNYVIENAVFKTSDYIGKDKLFRKEPDVYSYSKTVDAYSPNYQIKPFEYSYASEDQFDNLHVKIYYLVNPSLSHSIPDFVFKNLFQIAVFTKRNREALSLIKIQAIRAAISQVNARTTSHNTGSHILANNIENERKDNLTSFKIYLRQRMLYNADIASNSFKAFGPVSFTSLTESFKQLVIVKKYISGIEGKTFDSFSLDKNISNTELIVSLSNDTLGFQAIFILFENLIRNYFKHGKGSGVLFNKGTNSLKLKVKRVDYENPYSYCFEISDGTIIDDDNVYERISLLINSPILDSSNKLRNEGLGYLEIKAALCYLNDISLDRIDNPHVKNDSLKRIFEVLPITERDRTLRYQFILPKPFYIKLCDSSELNQSLLVKGIVDCQVVTEFDKHCLYYYKRAEGGVQKSSLTPRIVSQTALHKYNTKDINQLVFQFYEAWLTNIPGYESHSCYLLDGDKENVKYNKITYSVQHTITLQEEISSQQLKILLDDHGKRFDFIYTNKDKLGDLYYEDYQSLSYIGKKIGNLDFEKPYFLKQLFEAAKTKVVIFDERVQRHAARQYKEINPNSSIEGVSVCDALKLSNVYSPLDNTDRINLNAEVFDESLKNKLKTFAEEVFNSESANLKLNFLIIHLGVLEKFTSDKSIESINSIIQEIIPTCIDSSQIIVISERGTPDNLKESYRFLHFSNVAKYLIEEKSKLGLVNAIFNSRSLSIGNLNA